MTIESQTKNRNLLQLPAEFLRSHFLSRKTRNPSYSTRSFARDLGMSQALLSRIMNGKRPMTMKQAMQVSVLLELSKEDSAAFIETAFLCLPKNSKGRLKLEQQRARGHGLRPEQPALHVNYDIERFKVLSNWYHVALLDLCSTPSFLENSTWISKRLGISSIEAHDALERLVRFGFLIRKKSKLLKAEKNIFFQTTRSEPAMRSFHRQMLTKAVEQLEQTSDEAFERRRISSMTLTMSAEQVKEAIQAVEAFQREFASRFIQKTGDEVYQLNVQLFPLTKPVTTEK